MTSMEKEGPPQPLVSQPAMASAPPMPQAGEATPYYPGPPQEPYAVDHMTAAAAPPPYQAVGQTQQAMYGYGTPLLQQPTGHQGKDPSHELAIPSLWGEFLLPV